MEAVIKKHTLHTLRSHKTGTNLPTFHPTSVYLKNQGFTAFLSNVVKKTEKHF